MDFEGLGNICEEEEEEMEGKKEEKEEIGNSFPSF